MVDGRQAGPAACPIGHQPSTIDHRPSTMSHHPWSFPEFGRYVLGRIGLFVPTLLLLSAVTFFLGFLTPSDPVVVKLGQHADPVAVARLRHEYGLDRPAVEQFGRFLWRALHGDFGISYYDDSPVAR